MIINKFIKITIAICCVCVLLGCAKDESNLSGFEPTKQSVATLQKIQRLQGFEEARIAYASLSQNERHSLWMTKLQLAIESNKYNSNQVKLIKDIMKSLKIDFFRKGEYKEVFKTAILPDWIERSKSIFTKDEIYNLLFTLENSNGANFSISSSGDEQLPACHCARGSNWTCYLGGGNFANCWVLVAYDCVTQSTGCGAFMDDECDGNFCTN
ncbi:bacteriocin fulvocin C-related protein [Pedobacter faecalis]|uniref:bacteriocin fulvocin C-related protein n=1 Tax=Pedobacter faecalis TaxID=3041495 RepID=UPI00254E72DD|nr:bacteriocin fulvocin C-related protein [Pedobacter sp. ELA7]